MLSLQPLRILLDHLDCHCLSGTTPDEILSCLPALPLSLPLLLLLLPAYLNKSQIVTVLGADQSQGSHTRVQNAGARVTIQQVKCLSCQVQFPNTPSAAPAFARSDPGAQSLEEALSIAGCGPKDLDVSSASSLPTGASRSSMQMTAGFTVLPRDCGHASYHCQLSCTLGLGALRGTAPLC